MEWYKKNRELRVCIDYTSFKKAMQNDYFPLSFVSQI